MAVLATDPLKAENAECDGVMRTYLHWLGVDDRGIELEIIGRIALEDPDLVIVLHVMPTMLRDL